MERGGGRAGSDSPAQPRSPGFLSISPPRGSSFPGPLHVKASDPSTVRVSGTVRGSLQLAPGLGLQLSLPAWPLGGRCCRRPAPRILLAERCREGGVWPACEGWIRRGAPEAGRRRVPPGGGRGGWGPAQSSGRSHCFPPRSRGGSGGCDWDPGLARPDSAPEPRSKLHPAQTLITPRPSSHHGLRSRRGAGPLPARGDLGPPGPHLRASTGSRDAAAGRQGGRGTAGRGRVPKCERHPGDASAWRAWLADSVGGVGVRGGRRGPGRAPSLCGGRRVWAPLPTGFLWVAAPGTGSAKGDDLRRAPYRGWEPWSLASSAGTVRLRDLRRTGPLRRDASFRTWVSRLHLCPCAGGSLSASQLLGSSAESENGAPRNISRRVHLFPAPHSPLGFVRPRSPEAESRAGDRFSSPRTSLGCGPGPALVGPQPLALFPWLRRPASAPPPPLASPLGLRLQAPPAPPPANVALGPGPGPDSATRPSRSRRSSEGETRRAPGPRPTSCEALDTWISLAGG